MELKPYGSRVLAKQFDDDMVGSLYVPDHAKKGSLRATVVGIGDECEWAVPGDKIIVGLYAKFDVPLRGEEWRDHFILNEADILARIEGE